MKLSFLNKDILEYLKYLGLGVLSIVTGSIVSKLAGIKIPGTLYGQLSTTSPGFFYTIGLSSIIMMVAFICLPIKKLKFKVFASAAILGSLMPSIVSLKTNTEKFGISLNVNKPSFIGFREDNIENVAAIFLHGGGRGELARGNMSKEISSERYTKILLLSCYPEKTTLRLATELQPLVEEGILDSVDIYSPSSIDHSKIDTLNEATVMVDYRSVGIESNDSELDIRSSRIDMQTVERFITRNRQNIDNNHWDKVERDWKYTNFIKLRKEKMSGRIGSTHFKRMKIIRR
ncbi:hypothetical protein KO317_00835 [Candidatus Micrarchaeota archaeon]|jgi:hypothetical protein|nr:hypothetical protein [Candidatus Micrarchaeota archaeon]